MKPLSRKTGKPKDRSAKSRGRLSIVAAFEAQVKRSPGSIAVAYQGKSLTYDELNRRSNRLARHLRKLGVATETPVAVCLERSLEMVVGLLGVLKAGGAYVPLDPAYPTSRLEYMLADSSAPVLVTGQRLKDALPHERLKVFCFDEESKELERRRDSNPRISVLGEHLAYIMYTSGSTGKPKGVQVEQHSVVSLVQNNNYARLDPAEAVLQFAPISFDAATFEIWGALLNGGQLIIAPAGPLSPMEVGAFVREQNITTLWLTAGLFHVMVDGNLQDLQHVRQLLAGGDVLLPASVRKAANALQTGVVINGYGPTENTTFTCAYAVEDAEQIRSTVPIGRPLADAQVYILDQHGQRVPVGKIGELYVGGEGIARAYQNCPDLTAGKFVPNTFSARPGERLYRTGDLVRSMADGNLEFIGRVDEQVKIRGYRVEPGEIEAALNECAGVRAAAVVTRKDRQDVKRLIGYVVPDAGHSLTSSQIRDFLAERLPEYMVPVQFVFLDRLPLTAIGKVDRRSLPEPPAVEAAAGASSPTEELLAGVCSKVIGLDEVPLDASFMELGGSSLNATQAIFMIRDALSCDLPIRELLGGKTLREIAQELENSSGQAAMHGPAFRKWPRGNGLLPASYSQERVWFVHRLDPASLAYHFTATLTLLGDLDVTALGRALSAIVERHEIYRTTLNVVDGVLFQKIHEPWAPNLELVDASTQSSTLEQVIAQESRRPFDLTRLPLVRWKLVRLGPRRHVLVSVEHHVLHDGWSFNVFLKELTEFYRSYVENDVASVSSSPMQFADFAQWQREWMESGEARRQLAYWKHTLEGAPPVLLLPYDRPRPAVQTYEGDVPRMEISESLDSELAAQCRSGQFTMFMLYAAAFQSLLFRYSGQRDFCIGTGIANRRWSETRDLIGMLVNNIALRLQVSGDPAISEVLARIRKTTLDAYAHQDVPFDKIVQAVDPARDLRYNPIFQVLLSFHDSPVECPVLPGLGVEVEVGLSNGSAKFDMNVIVIPAQTQNVAAGYGPRTRILWEYNSSLFDAVTIQQMMRHYVRLLGEIANHPQRKISGLELLTPEERWQVLVEFNQTTRPFPYDTPVHDLFAEQARKTPQSVAAIYDSCQLTYAELDRDADQMAAHLSEVGVGIECRVGVCMERGLEMITGMIAILKAGGAYVPLDPAYPPDRLQFMVQDAGIRVVVTQAEFLALFEQCDVTIVRMDATRPQEDIRNASIGRSQLIKGGNLAYVMYTSGSTGVPKGTEIEHRNIVRLVRNSDYVQFSSEDRVAQIATASFDAATFEIWGALLNGGCLVGIGKETALNPRQLKMALDDGRITTMFLTASLFNQVVREDSAAFAGLKYLLVGGEALDPHSIRGVVQNGCPRHLINGYGPTEATTFSTWFHITEVADHASAIPIGLPLANGQAYVLDEWLESVPMGVAGELCVGGYGVGRGYLGRPALTAEKFVPDAFSSAPGVRLYRTGDLVRRLRNGNIEFLGRLDEQVKIRGFRIEPGEIAAVIGDHPAVQEAVVMVLEDQRRGKQLVAYVVARAGINHRDQEKEEDLRKYLRGKLPEYMVPWIVWLESFPLTINGKVDRKRLPLPKWDAAGKNREAVQPSTPTQELLASIWVAVLRVDHVDVHANFFELGGHSLLLMQLLSRIRGLFGIDVPVKDAFESQSLAALATRIDELLCEKNQRVAPPLVPVKRDQALPLSFAQQRLWFLQQFDHGSSVYNVPVALRIHGPLKVSALEQSLVEIVCRHEALRTTFTTESGHPVQVVHPAMTLQLPVKDLRGLALEEREATARSAARDFVHLPFDIARGPLLRVLLLQLDEQEHVFILCMHHIVSDGWSLDILGRELATLYEAHAEARIPFLPELPVQYADYAVWQRNWLQGEVLELQLRYWKQQLAGMPELLELPMALPRPPVHNHQGAFHHFQVPGEVADRLNEIARSRGVTPFMTLLAAFYVLLYRLTGQRDLVLGTPIAGRDRSETEGLVGFFVNSLVLRACLSPRLHFEELLQRVRETALGAFANSDIPFEKLVEEMQPDRALSRTPLFQMTFTLQTAGLGKWSLPGLRLRQEPLELHDAKFDFGITLTGSGHELSGYINYRTDMFDQGDIERVTRHYQHLLQRLPEDPSRAIAEVDLLTGEERLQVLETFNATAQNYPQGQTLQQLFEDRVALDPEATAVVSSGSQLTYGELLRRASRVARHLQRMGVRPEVVVGICLERSVEMVVAIFGILKAGGAYIPLAPEYPRKRLEQMIEVSGVRLVLSTAAIGEKLGRLAERQLHIEDLLSGELEPTGTIQSWATEENPAYVIFTSGSTGEPKGVVVPHRAICNHMMWMQQQFRLGPADRVLQKTEFSFDASVWEFFGPLLSGATLVMAEPGGHRDGEYLVRCLQQECITVLQLVPSQLYMLLQQKDFSLCHSLQRVYCGGEAMKQHMVREFCAALPSATLYNLYGPTECAIDSTWSQCNPRQQGLTSLIGGPIANAQAYVLDQEMMPVPIGVPGELFIGGTGLARGYLNRSGLTAERFVPSPFGHREGQRLYRTGDRVRLQPSGQLEFLERIDKQVKIRGYRIELDEIEAVLVGQEGVKQCVVVVRDEQLVAYVVGLPKHELDLPVLRRHLQERLPEYMVPLLVQLESLPLTPNGKIDISNLPLPAVASPDHETGIHTPTQELLAAIWTEVLGIPNVGVHDNFFSLGGHSLSIVRVASRIQEVFGAVISIRRLFECPQLSILAEAIDQSLSLKGSVKVPLLRPRKEAGPQPVSFAQLRLWFLQQFEPASGAYNVSVVLRMQGSLKLDVLEKAIAEIISRHESLRTTFAGDPANPEQVIHPPVPLALPMLDLRKLERSAQLQQAHKVIEEQSSAFFDLVQGPLLRVQVVQLASDEYLLPLTMHHIISDGWSLSVFTRELATLYKDFCHGASSSLPALPVQYLDYALWQRECFDGDGLTEQMSYWRGQLEGIPDLLPLPFANPRPAVPDYRGARHRFEISGELLLRLKQASRLEGVTLFMTLLGALQIVLHRYCGSDDIPVGTPHAGRNHSAVEELIGCFINTLVLRTDLSGGPVVRELLKRVRNVALGAYAHQVPFEKLVEELSPERDMSRTPLFQTLFVFQNHPEHECVLPGLNLTMEEIDPTAVKFDLGVGLKETGSHLAATISYRCDLFDQKTIAAMAGHFDCILVQLPEKLGMPLSSLDLLTPVERCMILEEWNSTAVEYPRQDRLQDLFEQQVSRTPNAIALIYQGEEFTYQELNRRANCLAHYLLKLGVGPEARAGIFLERSPEMVITMLGILKAGGAYVPLDPAYPADRLSYMLEDARVAVVLTQVPLLVSLPPCSSHIICLESEWPQIALESDRRPETSCSRDNLAYVIYTSGSTGRPKGVAIRHASVVTLMYWARDVFTSTMLKGVLASTSICFDLSVFEIFVPLSWGGTAILVGSVLDLPTMPQAKNITLLNTVPSAMRQLLLMKAVPASVATVALAGEPLSKTLVEQIYELDHVSQVFNLYGPSEDTTYSTYAALGCDAKTVSIGKPIANSTAYVLDGEMAPVPVSVAGELYLGGEGLARGYLDRPDLTATRFVPDPFADEASPGQRLYRTGDQVKWSADGSLEFLGRADHQVKLRGFRIELGEIESVLERHSSVRQSAVLVREDHPGGPRLVAYLVRNQESDALGPLELKSHLRKTLPEYMVPAAFVELPGLPLSPNGKVDRKQLASTAADALVAADDLERDVRRTPRNNSELFVIAIFEEVLGIKGLLARHNFFELGGHSLSALILAGRLSKTFSKHISVRNVFEYPTIEQMAAFAKEDLAGPSSSLIPIKSTGNLSPLFFVHPGGGRVMGYLPLSRSLNRNRPFYALQSQGLEEGQDVLWSVEDMAAAYIKEIQRVQPSGPYQIGGWCMGGTIAFEMAQQLHQAGETVSLLAILEDFAYSSPTTRPITAEELQQEEMIHVQKIIAQHFPPKFRISGTQLPREFSLSFQEQLELALAKFKETRQLPQDETPEQFHRAIHVSAVNLAAKRRYHFQPFFGKAVLFRCVSSEHPEETYGWGRLVQGGLDVHTYNWQHNEFVAQDPETLAKALEQSMEAGLSRLQSAYAIF